MSYLPCERETIIRFDDESEYAIVATYQRNMRIKLLNLKQKYPNDITVRVNDKDCVEVLLPKTWVGKITPKRKMKLTDEQREVRRSHMNKIIGKTE